MCTEDFEYDGKCLSDYGFIICEVNSSSGAVIINAGSQITFNKVARQQGKLYSLASTQYDECIAPTFDICKNPCKYDDLQITNDEYSEMMRWLNRREFLPFQFINETDADHRTCHYEASFNVDKIMINDKLYGLELTMETNSPFGYGDEITVSWSVTTDPTSETYVLSDESDEIGYTYPSMVITCDESGDLSIWNQAEDSEMLIKNVSAGEIITVDGSAQIITSSLDSHVLYDDFNFEFLRIGNTISDRDNYITVSLPCTITLTYSPIVKGIPD